MVLRAVLLVLLALLLVLEGGLLLLFAIGFVAVFLDNRRLLRILTNCPCPHCDATLGMPAAKRAHREWDKAPDGIQWTKCDRTRALEPDGEELEIIIHVQRDKYWPVSCNRCGQAAMFDMQDGMVYRSRWVGNEKLHAIAAAISENDIAGPIAPERLDAICLASGCDRIEVFQVVNALQRNAKSVCYSRSSTV